MPAEDKPGNDPMYGAVDELLTLQFEAQTAPVGELAHDVTAMLNELANALNEFNELVGVESCAPTAVQAAITEAVKLTIHIAIYSLAIGQRSPRGFYIGPPPASADVN